MPGGTPPLNGGSGAFRKLLVREVHASTKVGAVDGGTEQWRLPGGSSATFSTVWVQAPAP
jgi:hypothetical protein